MMGYPLSTMALTIVDLTFSYSELVVPKNLKFCLCWRKEDKNAEIAAVSCNTNGLCLVHQLQRS
jgi:hypothetical protein